MGFISGDLCVCEFYLCIYMQGGKIYSTMRKANETIKKGLALTWLCLIAG